MKENKGEAKMKENQDEGFSREWYEEVMTPANMMKYYEGIYQERNNALFEMMKPHLPSQIRVLDIAAGSCQMATKFLALDTLRVYNWNDFNRNLIKDVESREESGYLKTDNNFFTHDLDVEDVSGLRPLLNSSNVMICVSMEHIDNDIEIISELKKGSIVGICSPNFASRGHYRHFEKEEDVLERYSSLIDVKELTSLSFGKKEDKKKFLLCGERK